MWQYKILNRKQHQVYPVKEIVNVKRCVSKVSKYSIGRPCRPSSTLSSNISETAGPIKAKFHMEPHWNGGMKVCLNGYGHMTRMAAMPIYGKNPLKIFFSETSRLMTFKLGIQHWGLIPYKVYLSDDPGLTFTYFTARSTLLPNDLVLRNA